MGSISSRSVSLSLAEPLKFAWCAAASKGGLSSFPSQPRSVSFVMANNKQTNCWALGLVDTGVQLIFGKLLRMRWRQLAIGDLRVCMQSCKKSQLRLHANVTRNRRMTVPSGFQTVSAFPLMRDNWKCTCRASRGRCHLVERRQCYNGAHHCWVYVWWWRCDNQVMWDVHGQSDWGLLCWSPAYWLAKPVLQQSSSCPAAPSWIMFCHCALWWLRTTQKTISWKQSSEIISLAEAWSG